MTTAHNPRADAARFLAPGYEARVLEPSPPANTDPDFYADDPTDRSDATGVVVSPAGDGDVSWSEYVADHPESAAFAMDHWLGNLRRLGPLPPGYGHTRASLHQVAYFVIAPKRYGQTGKLGLRYTHGGFGTPFFGASEQVRIQDGVLVRQRGADVASHTLSTLGEAASFLGMSYREQWFEGFHDPLAPIGESAPLQVDSAAASALGDWFGFATHVLERLRRTPGAEDVSRIQLWPEHFDPALEMGARKSGHRASYGASPGDDSIPEPYLYVAAWADIDRSNTYWNGASFDGSFLPYSELIAAEDQTDTALRFYMKGHRLLVD